MTIRSFRTALELKLGPSALLSIVLGLTSASAQAPDPHLAGPRSYAGPSLSLPEAIDEALAKNADVLALRAQIPVLQQRPAQARALAPPMLEGTIWQWPTNTANPLNTNMYMLMVGQDLPGRGKRDLRAVVAEKDLALAENDVVSRTRQVVNDVKQAYASLFLARQATDVHLAGVELLRQVADASQAKYATGRISQQDVLKAVVELSRLHSDLLMLDEQAQIATARLNVLRNLAPDTPIGPLLDPDLGAPSLSDLARLQEVALERHPELQGARLDVERAEAELASARSEYKPDFTVQGGYLVMPHQTDALLARVGITWPKAPWARGKIDAQVAERTAAVDAAVARQRATENMVRLGVHEAYVRVTSARDRANLLQTTILPQSRQTLDVSRVAYQTDRVDFQAVIDNERTLLTSQLEYFRALSDFQQALGDLERAIGTDVSAVPTSPAPLLRGGVR